MTMNTYHSRALKAWVAALLAAGLMALAGPKPARAAEPNFAPAQHFSVGTSPTTVTNADFNGDGKVDLVAQNFGTDNVSVLLGNGNGTFQDKKDFTVGDGPTAVVSGQFNDDNADNKVDSLDFVDLAVANQNSRNVSVLLGKGDGTFQDKKDFAVDSADDSCSGCSDPVSLIAADYNGDGKADLAVANQNLGFVEILLGVGDGSFQAARSFVINQGCNQIITDDFNGDGKADLAVTDTGTDITRGSVWMYLGNGDGTFGVRIRLLQLDGAFSVASGDFNDDGKADIAATGPFSSSVLVALGNGNGTFEGKGGFAVGATPTAVTSADFDGDGYDDMAVSNHDSDNVSVLYSNGDGSFQAAQHFMAGDGPIFVDAPNVNADNYPDLAIVNESSNNVSVLTNNKPPNTSIDSGPTGTVTSRSASFTFSSSQANSNFECSLDGAPFASCTSPKTVPDGGLLADGSHTFKVRATDATGHTDPTPATRTWTVGTIAPSVPIIASPADGSILNVRSFTVSGTAEAASTVELFEGTTSKGTITADSSSGAWSIALSGVSEGAHTYYAKATDAEGNTSAASNSVSVMVDTAPPETNITSGPSGLTNDNTPAFSFSGSDNLSQAANLRYSYKVDGSAWSSYSSETSVTLGGTSGLPEGSHTFYVKAKDEAGNEDQSPAQRSFTVDTTKPTVTATTPLNRTTNVARGTDLTATFSEKMRTSSIITPATTFKLFKVNSDGTQTQITDVVVSLSSDGLKATLNPFGTKTTLLARNTKYKGVISTGTKDLAGNSLAQQKSWTFTTKS